MSTEARALLYFATYLRKYPDADDAVSRIALANARRWAERIIGDSCDGIRGNNNGRQRMKYQTFQFDVSMVATIRIVAEDESTARATLQTMRTGAAVKVTDARGQSVEFPVAMESIRQVRTGGSR